jgi:hypothetical protein
MSSAAPLLRLLQWLLRLLPRRLLIRLLIATRPADKINHLPRKTASRTGCNGYRSGAASGYCSLLLPYGPCFDSDSPPVSLTRSPPPPTASYRRLLPHVLQLQLLPITGATNRSSPLLLRLLLRLRLLKRHPSRQQDHPRRQMAATGRNGSTTFRLLLSVATAAAAATATATATAAASASAPETSPFSPTRSPTSPNGYYWPQWLYYFPATAFSCYGCCCGCCYCFGFGS